MIPKYMLKSILPLLAIILTISCQRYEYELIRNGETIAHSSITARNDEDACIQAATLSDGAVLPKFAVDFNGNLLKKYLDDQFALYEIRVRNSQGTRVVNDTIIPTFIKRQAKLLRDEEIKAFAGAEFGMAKEVVLTLPYYKDFRKEGKILRNSFAEIGNYHFNVDVVFDKNNKLDAIEIKGMTYDFYDFEDVNEDVMCLMSYITGRYGHPNYWIGGLPKRQDVPEGETYCVYTWHIGEKCISIDVTHESQEHYQMLAVISTFEYITSKAAEAKEKQDLWEQKRASGVSLF